MSTDTTDLEFAELYRRLDAAEAALRSDTVSEAERSRILQERARALSVSRAATVEDTLPVLGFRVAGDRYAFEVKAVDEILPITGLSPLPGVPRSVLGVLQARTQVVLVVDLRVLLGVQGGMSDLTQVVVILTPEGPLGIAVEVVEGRLELPRSRLTSGGQGPFRFLSEDRCAVLDLDWFQQQAGES